jgi:hypothetical protein
MAQVWNGNASLMSKMPFSGDLAYQSQHACGQVPFATPTCAAHHGDIIIAWAQCQF